MIVLDTSVFIDALVPRSGKRHAHALSLMKIISERELAVYGPKILLVELACVLSRYRGPEDVRKVLESLSETINLIGEDALFDVALKIGMDTHCRAVDAYFIAVAKMTGSILVSNDRVMVINARKTGLEAYYLLEEHGSTIRRIKSL
ncbi:PIN domain-containing protein [Candidatus Bathyarchaeota archaeon]|mgnify:CR=1 FL=1|nr:MAG: PIN domain-containing protein [Candidatus Bathyarchaeota archaeon]